MPKKEEKCLYEVLGVAKDAPQPEIRKAYLRLAVQLHPDKNPGDEEAKAKFQALQRIYAVLSDEGKRASYDRTGSLDAAEGLAGESFDELYAYFRDKYKEVTPADLDDYELAFRGSPDEQRELFELYARFRGAMGRVYGWLVCSDHSRDDHRFAAAVRRGIASGELESYPAFVKWCRAKVDGKAPPAEDPLKPRPRAAEMEAAAGKKGKGASSSSSSSSSSLALQIRANNGGDRLAGIIASIEARAASGDKKMKKKKGGAAAAKEAAAAAAPKSKKRRAEAPPPPPPTDEEFEAAAARLEARRRASNGKA